VQNEDGSWRTRLNHELNELIENADIVRFIKSRRIAWPGQVMRMDEKRTPKRVLEWKSIVRRIRRRPRKRWIENIEEDTGCPRRNGQNFGRVFLMLNYTDITRNTYIQS